MGLRYKQDGNFNVKGPGFPKAGVVAIGIRELTIAYEEGKKFGIRFWSYVDKTKLCWLWTGSKNPNGYGQINVFVDGKRGIARAHRVSYEMANGPIQPGLKIDHICRVRHCVRPDHLEAVTERENILRGIGPTAINARKKNCPRGHPLSGENLYSWTNGKRSFRECRICRAAHRAKREPKKVRRLREAAVVAAMASQDR